MDSEDLQPGFSEPRESAPLEYIPIEPKVTVMIREEIHVKIEDIGAVKHSFEKWSKQWD